MSLILPVSSPIAIRELAIISISHQSAVEKKGNLLLQLAVQYGKAEPANKWESFGCALKSAA
jgi:hypothetical protein